MTAFIVLVLCSLFINTYLVGMYITKGVKYSPPKHLILSAIVFTLAMFSGYVHYFK